MEERRRSNRWQPQLKCTSTIRHDGIEEDVQIVNVSSGGMKATFSNPLSIGVELHGRLKILPDSEALFVKGTVLRVEARGDMWDAAVRFDNVVLV